MTVKAVTETSTNPALHRAAQDWPLLPMPAKAGVGLKPQHYQEILHSEAKIGWFEVHAENYMGAGGPPHHFLTRIREQYPLSVHGVGLSLGGPEPLDLDHLARVKQVVDRYQPALFSEHLAWSTHEGAYFNDLLPLPYTQATLDQVVAHIDQVQNTLGRQMLLENPSTYVAFQDNDMDEISFLTEISRRSGCGLLLDVNNVYVSSTNHQRSAFAYIEAFPKSQIGEIHLGGHNVQEDDAGAPLLIDSHDDYVTNDVWKLYEALIAEAGPKPTLVEWDSDIPEWSVLMAEASRADAILAPSHQRVMN